MLVGACGKMRVYSANYCGSDFTKSYKRGLTRSNKYKFNNHIFHYDTRIHGAKAAVVNDAAQSAQKHYSSGKWTQEYLATSQFITQSSYHMINDDLVIPLISSSCTYCHTVNSSQVSRQRHIQGKGVWGNAENE